MRGVIDRLREMRRRFRRARSKRRFEATRRAALAAVNRPIGARGRPHGLPAPLIVSLTSYAARFGTLHLTIRGLLHQSMAPDRIILWVSEQDYARLPPAVRELEQAGLGIERTPDIGPYTKLIPALRRHPDAFILTVDDDCYYAPDTVERLVSAFCPETPQILCLRAHLARISAAGRLLPYNDWGFNTLELAATTPDTRLFPTGIGGVLYPPNAMSPIVLDEARFLALCPKADDIWFFWMARLIGTPQVRLPGRHQEIAWSGTQDVGLFNSNLIGSANDPKIAAMERSFGPVP